jgi:predicted  nucleic acid-binding Zn-ribbon protein
MPNKCTKCGKLHPDDAEYLMNGCDACGSKFFFYIRKEVVERSLKEVEEITKGLTEQDVQEMEQDIRDIVPEYVKDDETVILDLEAIRILKPGKYLIDVTNLFTQRPIVIKIGPGKYELDLSTLITEKEKEEEGET